MCWDLSALLAWSILPWKCVSRRFDIQIYKITIKLLLSYQVVEFSSLLQYSAAVPTHPQYITDAFCVTAQCMAVMGTDDKLNLHGQNWNNKKHHYSH